MRNFFKILVMFSCLIPLIGFGLCGSTIIGVGLDGGLHLGREEQAVGILWGSVLWGMGMVVIALVFAFVIYKIFRSMRRAFARDDSSQ